MKTSPIAPSIGIWDLDADGLRYRRRPGRIPRWADLAGFDLRHERPRVALFGESVARALFYDPAHTLADLIGRGTDHRAEVVDLARTGGRVEHIQNLAEQARSLEPDVAVLFAGNNWKYELSRHDPARARREAEALADSGIPGLLRVRERALAELARRTVLEFCAAFDPATEILVVVPESNLLDWHPRPLIPVLGNGLEKEWLALDRRLAAGLDAEDWEAVIAVAEQIHALDGGVSDGPHRAKGQAQLALGFPEQALRSYRRARDVRLWAETVDPSWLPSAGAAAAREAAAETGADLLDLTEVLPRLCASGVPDADVFADFCHLNSRGLAHAAAEIAARTSALLRLAPPRDGTPGGLPDWRPAADVEAGARFCAAIIGADFAQPTDRIRAHAEAAKQVPDVAEAMRAFCTAGANRAPWWMRSGRLSAIPTIRRFIEDVGWDEGYRYNDRLFEVFADQFDAETSAQIKARVDRTVPPAVRTSLLDPIYAPAWRPEGWEGLLDGAAERRHYFRGHEQHSAFDFRLGDPGELDIEITARLGPGAAGSAVLTLNGEHIATFEVTDRWRSTTCTAAGRTGRNEIGVEWRRERFDTLPYRTAAHRLQEGLPHELHLVFGEIHSLSVTTRPHPTTESEGDL